MSGRERRRAGTPTQEGSKVIVPLQSAWGVPAETELVLDAHEAIVLAHGLLDSSLRTMADHKDHRP